MCGMMKSVHSRLLASLLGAALMLTSAIQAPASEAQAPRAVIELFTSQGCSSCPPADAMVVALAQDDDIIALTLHVDYWDYLGWRDTLAKPEFSDRQRNYAQLRGDRGVFTPQMVVNGEEACIGSDEQALSASLAKATREHARLPVPIRVTRDGTDLTIALEGDYPGGANLYLMMVEPQTSVTIKRGENKGREAHYANVVRRISHVALWDGEAGTIVTAMSAPGDGFVVMLQQEEDGHAGRIIGAARGPALAAGGS